jgi:putative ATPase
MTNEPLASRFRPQTLDDIIGQDHILGPGKMLTRLIQSDSFGCLIFYGPPGTGKTTIASVIAHTTHADFRAINATTSGKADMQKIIAAAEENQKNGKKTILFIDEIHRFNKAQQDYLLPFTETGVITLIGATTENPYFEVNNALISRSTVFELKPIDTDSMKQLIVKAVYDKNRGMGLYDAVIYQDAVDFLADIADGDARRCLNAIELGITTTERDANTGKIEFTLDVAKESIQKRVIKYDKDGDNHYDTICAFIKSMRGSDPDAAVYYLARMLQGGEDIKYIARRIMIHASEDVGMADPMALVVATNAAMAVERVGMPEAQIILANAAIYIAMAPKSASVIKAIQAANTVVQKTGNLMIPSHIQDAHYRSATKLNRGVGYLYPHDYPNHWVAQEYMPAEIRDIQLYEPSDSGFEKQINDYHKSVVRKETKNVQKV